MSFIKYISIIKGIVYIAHYFLYRDFCGLFDYWAMASAGCLYHKIKENQRMTNNDV